MRTVAVLRPPRPESGLLIAMTKFAWWRLGSYQVIDDSQRRTEVAEGVMGATRTLPSLTTVVAFACQ